MPAQGAFSCKQKVFLESKRPYFATAVDNKQMGDAVDVILWQYFKCFPINLNDKEEPSDDALAAVDDDAADPEVNEPLESLGPEEYVAAVQASADHQECIQTKREVSFALFGVRGVDTHADLSQQIACWFAYCYTKERNIDPRSNNPRNLYNALLLQLTGNFAAVKPRRKAPVNVWVHDKSSIKPIKDKIRLILNGQVVEQKKMVAVRSEVACAVFQKLPAASQEHWKRVAAEEYTKSMAKYEQVCKEVVSTSPEAQQRYVTFFSVKFTSHSCV